MRELTFDERVCCVGGDLHGGVSAGSFWAEWHITDQPSTSTFAVGFGSYSFELNLGEAGFSSAMFGMGALGTAAKAVGAQVVEDASDAGYTGSLMEMEGFTTGTVEFNGGGWLEIWNDAGGGGPFDPTLPILNGGGGTTSSIHV